MPWQHDTRQQGWYFSGTLRKQFPNLIVQFILSLCIVPGKVTVDEGLGEHLALWDVVELLLQDVLLDLLKVLNVLVVGQLQGDHSHVTFA